MGLTERGSPLGADASRACEGGHSWALQWLTPSTSWTSRMRRDGQAMSGCRNTEEPSLRSSGDPRLGSIWPSVHVSCSGPGCLDSEGSEEALGKAWSPPEAVPWALKVRAAAPASQECGDQPRPWEGLLRAQVTGGSRAVRGHGVTPRHLCVGSAGHGCCSRTDLAWTVTASLAVTQPLSQTLEARGSGHLHRRKKRTTGLDPHSKNTLHKCGHLAVSKRALRGRVQSF